MGWEPEERHEHYDPAGNLTGYTVVTRDPEFDNGDLERLLALGRYEAGVCDCGVHESLTLDKGNHFTFDVRTCPVCRGQAQYGRVMSEQDERADKALGEKPAATTPRSSDGRHVSMRMMSALEVAARREGLNVPDRAAVAAGHPGRAFLPRQPGRQE